MNKEINIGVHPVDGGFQAVCVIPDGALKGPIRKTEKETKKDIKRLTEVHSKWVARQTLAKTLYDSKQIEKPKVSDVGFLAGIIEKEVY